MNPKNLPLLGKLFLEHSPETFYEYTKTLNVPYKKTEVTVKIRTKKKRDAEDVELRDRRNADSETGRETQKDAEA